MMNKTLVDWTSKCQATVETTMYGSKNIATRVAVDQIIEFGVLLTDYVGPSYSFSDNTTVVDSATIPEYNLKKRHHALLFHCVLETVASKIVQHYHIDGDDNPAEVLNRFLLYHKW